MGHYRFLCGREVGEKYFDITIQIYFSKLKRADEKHQVVYLNQKLKKTFRAYSRFLASNFDS